MNIMQLKFKDVSTHEVVIELDVVRSNIERLQICARAHHLNVRPHIKTYKLPHIAEIQMAAEAIGINCQKVSEAEAMEAASPAIDDLVRIVPNHACVVSSMVDTVQVFDGDDYVGRWPVVARGCVV